MNEHEQQIATSLYSAMMQASESTERAEQDRQFRVGVSAIGHCSELMRRMLAGIEPEGTQDWLAAIIGTAVGDWIEAHAVPQVWPDAITQAEVVVTLATDMGTFNIPGHPDIIVPSERLVLDNKGTNGLEFVRRNGPKQQQQFQRHLYGYALWKDGTFGDCAIEDVRVGNVWHDRSAVEKCLHVQIEPCSMEVVNQASDWLSEVVYAYLHDTEARKEPHYNFCEGYCPHFTDCRLGETDAEGLITDPDLIEAVDMIQQAKRLEAEAKRLKVQAQIALNGVQGSTGEWSIRWVHVNGGAVEYYREGYERLDIRRVR